MSIFFQKLTCSCNLFWVHGSDHDPVHLLSIAALVFSEDCTAEDPKLLFQNSHIPNIHGPVNLGDDMKGNKGRTQLALESFSSHLLRDVSGLEGNGDNFVNIAPHHFQDGHVRLGGGGFPQVEEEEPVEHFGDWIQSEKLTSRFGFRGRVLLRPCSGRFQVQAGFIPRSGGYLGFALDRWPLLGAGWLHHGRI